jgi:hypothetical protein
MEKRMSAEASGRPDQPADNAAPEAAGEEADPACTPVPHAPADPQDLATLSDIQLIILYETTAPDDAQVDRIANEMESRGLDYPEAP